MITVKITGLYLFFLNHNFFFNNRYSGKDDLKHIIRNEIQNLKKENAYLKKYINNLENYITMQSDNIRTANNDVKSTTGADQSLG